MELNLTNFKLYCYNIEYNKYNNLFIKLQEHVEYLYNKSIININERNIRLSNIYIIINNLNNQQVDTNINLDIIYNNIIDKIKLQITNLNIEHIYEYIYNYNLINLTFDKILFPLKSINKLIIKFGENIGLNRLSDILIIYNIKSNIKSDNLFNLYNNIFIPISVKIINNFSYTNYILELINNNSDFFSHKIFIINKKSLESIETIETNNEELLDNNYILYLNLDDKFFYINGFFKLDPLQINIRLMNKLVYKKIYYKKLQIQNKIPNYEKFKHKYLKYCSIQEIITLSTDDFIKNLHIKYLKFNEINNKSFPTLMKDFFSKNINLFNWYETIKLLLLGSDENINIAGSLFSLLRDKKTNICLVSDIIYNNLVFCNQMKLKKINQTLKNELEKLNELNFDSIDHKKKLASCIHIPQYVKVLTMEKINEMKLNNNDYNKQLTFVKTILQFPWNITDDNNIFRKLNNSKEAAKNFIQNLDLQFNKITYGHLNVKKQISLLVTKLISNPDCNGTAIGLSGPPGVGKTLIAQSLAKLLDIPMVMITLGGQNDAELLIGHGYTYSGAQPGLIIKKICEANNSRCIMYFDELDKSCTKHGSTNEITSILIHLTDPNTNKSFQDRFFQGIDFPLNKIIFIGSYNDSSKIDPILLDRLIEIEVKSYNINDKIIILKNFIIPELKENIGLKHDIIIDDVSIKKFIYEYTYEAGVRDLKHKIEQVLLNINKDILLDNLVVNDIIKLDYDLVISYLDITNKYNQKLIPLIDQVGYINGLYATSNGGGGITSIEIYPLKIGHDFQLKLTGSMGDVMKESIQVAFTIACNFICVNYSNLITDINKYIKDLFPWGFHIHAPEGATPKDGPSAGTAFAIGFVSVILNRKISRTVAITGEINLSGNITKIGGLVYKIIGAKYAGVCTVLIPEQNKTDVDEIIKNHLDLFDENFNYYYINTLLEAINYILI